MIKSRKIRWEGNVAGVGGEAECIEGIDGKARRKGITRETLL
jgi:hypothetical protein